ncbi:MAG: 4-fold beta flower protein [Terracidiphilus sp.]
MEALYNERGAVYAWFHASGNIYGLGGEAVAFVDGDSVYDWSGSPIGWWADGHMRDAMGAVCLFTAKATNTGVVKPVVEVHQLRPLSLSSQVRPLKWPKAAKPPKLWSWSTKMPF